MNLLQQEEYLYSVLYMSYVFVLSIHIYENVFRALQLLSVINHHLIWKF